MSHVSASSPAAAQTKSVYHGDDRFRKIINRIKQRSFEKAAALRDRSFAFKLADVSSGDEGFFARAGNHQNAHRIVFSQFIERGNAFRVNFRIQSV